MTLIEKILANHSNQKLVKPGDIIDVFIDARVARDFGGANVVKNLVDNDLKINDPAKTFFTFDCNPGGSDQKYAANQHFCRQFASKNNIKVYDVNTGIGTHIAIDNGLAYPGSTFVSTDSHANIMGAIGCFGQGMGDQDIAAAWSHGSVWFKVPESVKLNFTGDKPSDVTAKDIVLNLLSIFGANKLLGLSVELYGKAIDKLTLDERITIASMATEMGAIILFFTPTDKVFKDLYIKRFNEINKSTNQQINNLIKAGADAEYSQIIDIDISKFTPMIARPGHPHDVETLHATTTLNVKIDSAFIGSCTNGRMNDLRAAAEILKDRKVAPGVVLKIVPSTDEIWKQALEEGLIKIFKEAGALVSNAGCAGCAAGQIGQNGPDEVTISTGNRNFAGKQGKGFVYLASPQTVAASAIAGYISTPEELKVQSSVFRVQSLNDVTQNPEPTTQKSKRTTNNAQRTTKIEGRVWIINIDNIDTDMIYHNRYLTITDIKEMGQYTFDNLKGYEDFAKKAKKGDIIITGKNFGAGSSRQQAVDCFLALGIQCIMAESFGAIYERNAINAALPILTYKPEQLFEIGLNNSDNICLDLNTGELINLNNNKTTFIGKFYDVQTKIYHRGGLL